MEDLLAKHRKEKRDLQARITQKKKSATKKTRKGVNDECERLERELAEKQQAEVDQLEPNDAPLESAVDGLKLDELDQEAIDEPKTETAEVQAGPANGDHTEEPPRSKKPNRQKARLARRAAEQQAQAVAAAAEAENMPDLRDQEISSMKTQMETRGLVETMIRPDGHCLFSACAHSMSPEQVSKSGPKKEPYQNVRYAAAEFMAANPDDFAAFMEEPLESYVQKIRDTAEWGGQLELQAISQAYSININVLQADGRVEKISCGTEKAADTHDVWLAYYRHSFGLGEHYNALKKVDKS
ncbi:OTU protein [Exophiala xenobiotica]|nr:OTU protein [Exophiala xenobiotica]